MQMSSHPVAPFTFTFTHSIINVSSVLGALTVADMGVYSASKHAMESLSDALRRELRPLDVSVSIIQPGA